MYQVTVIDKEGRKKELQEEVWSSQLQIEYTQKGWTVIKVEERKVKKERKEERAKKSRVKKVQKQSKVKKKSEAIEVTKAERIEFFRVLARLLGGHVHLVEALKIIKESFLEKEKTKKLVDRIRRKVEEGESLSEALKQTMKGLPAIYIAYIKSAEESGSLDQGIQRVADIFEENHKIMIKVREACLYPSIILVISIVAMGVLLYGVVPRFIGVLQEMGKDIPLLTKVIFGISIFLKENGIILFLSCIIIGVAGGMVNRTLWGQEFFIRVLLKLPIIGEVYQNILVQSYLRNMGLLVSGGVSIEQSIEILYQNSQGRFFKKILGRVMMRIREGQDFSKAHQKEWLIPDIVQTYLYLGEQNGDIVQGALEAASVLQEKRDIKLSRVIALLTPLLIIGLGIWIGIIVLSVLLPMLNATDIGI